MWQRKLGRRRKKCGAPKIIDLSSWMGANESSANVPELPTSEKLPTPQMRSPRAPLRVAPHAAKDETVSIPPSPPDTAHEHRELREVKMNVAKQGYAAKEQAKETSKVVPIVEVTFFKETADTPIGLTIEGDTGAPRAKVVVPGGIAEKAGIYCGLRLLEVNGVAVEGHQHGTDMIKASAGRTHLKMVKDELYA